MRCRISILMLVGMTAAGLADGQALRYTGPGTHSIERHWPDDGAANPTPNAGAWDGDDAVGLQLRDHGVQQNNTVPVSVLKLPSEAVKEMNKSDKALKAGDVRGSAEHLERMLELTPDFAIGHNGLGARYVVLGEYDRAVQEFQKAVQLQPKYRLAMDNIAVAFCMQHRFTEAEPMARWALQIQPDAPSSKYLLGSILVSEDKPTEEALQLLRNVQDQYPRARLFLAKAFVMHGEPGKAVEELRAYVSSPKATDNGVAERWLERLEKELSTPPTMVE